MRFYDFYEGQILIDDRDIRDFPMTELREKMGLVLQDAFHVLWRYCWKYPFTESQYYR